MWVFPFFSPPSFHTLESERECVLFIVAQFSNLYTAVDTSAMGRVVTLFLVPAFIISSVCFLSSSIVEMMVRADIDGKIGSFDHP